MSLPKEVFKKRNLPTLPHNIHQLLNVLTRDELTFQQLADTIKHYPAIAARIIALSNSAWSAPVSTIATIDHACSRLGLTVVRSVSIALAVASPFDPRRCILFDPSRFWCSSMLVAEGAEMLATYAHHSAYLQDFCKTVQTAGILHNIGLLWLADNLPEATNKALQTVNTDNDICVVRALRQYADTDYCEIGGWLAKEWNMPDILIAPIEFHMSELDIRQTPDVVFLISCAAQMAALLHKKNQAYSINLDLSHMGISSENQMQVFQALLNKQERIQNMVKALFD